MTDTVFACTDDIYVVIARPAWDNGMIPILRLDPSDAMDLADELLRAAEQAYKNYEAKAADDSRPVKGG